eukprot:SAG22_NODE_386_length_11304_cov_3.084694_1_plen_777_part_00
MIDLSPIRTRSFFWSIWRTNFKNGVKVAGLQGSLSWYGISDWQVDPWQNANSPYIKAPFARPAGLGVLLYPPWPGASLHDGVISSVRWEATRMGLEDAEYLMMLLDLLRGLCSKVETVCGGDAVSLVHSAVAALERVDEVVWGWPDSAWVALPVQDRRWNITEPYSSNTSLVHDVLDTVAAAIEEFDRALTKLHARSRSLKLDDDGGPSSARVVDNPWKYKGFETFPAAWFGASPTGAAARGMMPESNVTMGVMARHQLDYFAVSSKWTDNGGMNWHEQFSKVRCGPPTALLPEVSGNGTLYVREFERCLVRYDSACAGPDGTGCGTITAKTDDMMSDVLPGLSIFPGHNAAIDCTCIPVLIAIPGRLIALTEERLLDCSDGGTKTIALRASDDGGQNFSPQVAVIANSTSTNLGGALWDNVTQTLLVTYTTLGGCLACDYAKWGSAKCNIGGCRNLWLRRSTDYGRTFLPVQNISGAIWGAPGICSGGNNCKIGEFLLGGPTKGVQLADGTLVMLVVALSAPTPGFPGGGLVSLRSTDSGLHWTLGTPRFVRGWSETSLTLLPGGELLANGRCGPTFAACGGNGANASRLFARSTDGGVTFGAGPHPRAGIRGAQCAGDTISLPDGTLIFSHPAGLEHVDDRSHGGSFVGNCFDYPRQVPGKRCSKLSECPFAGDAPCRSNLTIIASRDGGVNWTPWKQDFWEGFPAYPWEGGGALPFPARAGYSSLTYIEAKDSASGRAEVAIMFEATGEVGPQRLIRFDAMHASVIRDVRVPV